MMVKKMARASFLVVILVMVSACASGGKVVPRHAKVQTISFGTILEREEVTLGGTNTGIGSYAGSLAAVVDSTSDSFVSLFLRGIAGGIVGAVAEERVTRSKGVQYTIERNNGDIVDISTKVATLNVGDCVRIKRGGRRITLEPAGGGLCSSGNPVKQT